jgi:hypothetical protein
MAPGAVRRRQALMVVWRTPGDKWAPPNSKFPNDFSIASNLHFHLFAFPWFKNLKTFHGVIFEHNEQLYFLARLHIPSGF